MTIENSSVHDVNYRGINLISNQTPPSLTAIVTKNEVGSNNVFNIYSDDVNVNITGNVLDGGYDSMFTDNSSVGSITGNTVVNASNAGIVLGIGASMTIKSNIVLNSTAYGIYLVLPNNATIELNTIAKTSLGIEFGCNTTPITIKSNAFSDVINTALDGVPSSFVSTNTYLSVGTIRNNRCGF